MQSASGGFYVHAGNAFPVQGIEPTDFQFYWFFAGFVLRAQPSMYFYDSGELVTICKPNVRSDL